MSANLAAVNKSHDAADLRGTIETMDALSHEGFSGIAAVARLALLSLETPEGQSNSERLAGAFRMILEKADTIQSCINSEAERAGAAFIDESARKRAQAYREAKG